MQAGESLYDESPFDDKGKRKNGAKNYYGAELIWHYVKEYADGKLESGKNTDISQKCKKEWGRIFPDKVAEKYDWFVNCDYRSI